MTKKTRSTEAREGLKLHLKIEKEFKDKPMYQLLNALEDVEEDLKRILKRD